MQDHRPEASILIVGYRSKPYIERCLEGALRASEGESVEILFIDCSEDGSEALVRERFPSVRVLGYRGNLGFARGNNVLAQEARGRKLLLLNPDAFAERDEIAALLRLSRARPEAHAWAGITILPDGSIDGGSIQPMLGAIPLLLAMFGLASLRPGAADPKRREPQRVPVLTGAFMLVDAAVWNRLHGFDERFFMYAEEVDLCRRIAEAGGVLVCDPSIRMLHDTGSGERRTPARMLNRARGNATFYRKHFGPCRATLCKLLLLSHAFSRAAWGSLARRRAHAESFGAIVRQRRDWWDGWPEPAGEARRA
ncbi:MAG: glycosyltransferase family 2 protein [bacterium]